MEQLLSEIEAMKAKLTELKIIEEKKEAERLKHNQTCLNWYYTNKQEVAERRKAKYYSDNEYREQTKLKRRERYKMQKEGGQQTTSQ
jgi:hypothetical protein